MRRQDRKQRKSAILAILILGVTFNTGCGPFITAIIQLVTAAISLGGGGGGGGGLGGMIGGATGAAGAARPSIVNNTPTASASLVAPATAQGTAGNQGEIGIDKLKQGSN